MTGRAIRTKDWTYCVADPSVELREELKKLSIAAGEPEPEIVPAQLYP